MKINIGDHRCFWLATTLVSAVIPLDELLILSCWMIVNCFLLKHDAKQCRLYRHFVGRQNVTWLTPSPPKRQNDEKNSLESPLTGCWESVLQFLPTQGGCLPTHSWECGICWVWSHGRQPAHRQPHGYHGTTSLQTRWLPPHCRGESYHTSASR